jgi:hypothetical protein
MAIDDQQSAGPVLWRVLDRLDYWVTQARLWMADMLRAPLPDCDTRD